MKTACLEDFIQFFPHMDTEYIKNLYMQPFYAHILLECFEGWEYDTYYQCFIDQTEERNIIRFEESTYIINAQKFKKPGRLNEFIEDCQKMGIALLWSESMADKLWFTPYAERSTQKA